MIAQVDGSMKSAMGLPHQFSPSIVLPQWWGIVGTASVTAIISTDGDSASGCKCAYSGLSTQTDLPSPPLVRWAIWFSLSSNCRLETVPRTAANSKYSLGRLREELLAIYTSARIGPR